MVVDFYSGFIEVKQLQEISSSYVITFFKELFYKYGVPGTLVTNKGQQFTSHDSSSHHHRANDKLEFNDEAVISSVKKKFKDKKDPWQSPFRSNECTIRVSQNKARE